MSIVREQVRKVNRHGKPWGIHRQTVRAKGCDHLLSVGKAGVYLCKYILLALWQHYHHHLNDDIKIQKLTGLSSSFVSWLTLALWSVHRMLTLSALKRRQTTLPSLSLTDSLSLSLSLSLSVSLSFPPQFPFLSFTVYLSICHSL